MKVGDIVSINFPTYREGEIVIELPNNKFLIVWNNQLYSERLVSGPYDIYELLLLYSKYKENE